MNNEKINNFKRCNGLWKRTFIKEYNLEKFTLSSDQIRLIFNAPQMNIKYYEEIPQFNNKKVWDYCIIY